MNFSWGLAGVAGGVDLPLLRIFHQLHLLVFLRHGCSTVLFTLEWLALSPWEQILQLIQILCFKCIFAIQRKQQASDRTICLNQNIVTRSKVLLSHHIFWSESMSLQCLLALYIRRVGWLACERNTDKVGAKDYSMISGTVWKKRTLRLELFSKRPVRLLLSDWNTAKSDATKFQEPKSKVVVGCSWLFHLCFHDGISDSAPGVLSVLSLYAHAFILLHARCTTSLAVVTRGKKMKKAMQLRTRLEFSSVQTLTGFQWRAPILCSNYGQSQNLWCSWFGAWDKEISNMSLASFLSTFSKPWWLFLDSQA